MRKSLDVNINIHIQRKNLRSKLAKKARKRIREANKTKEMQLKRASKKNRK